MREKQKRKETRKQSQRQKEEEELIVREARTKKRHEQQSTSNKTHLEACQRTTLIRQSPRKPSKKTLTTQGLRDMSEIMDETPLIIPRKCKQEI